MRTAFYLLAMFCVLSGCASFSKKSSQAKNAEKSLEITPEEKAELVVEVEDEILMGREMAAKLLGFYGKSKPSEKSMTYVNLIGNLLARNSGRPEIKFRFGILNSEEINAFATPGGYIFVTEALLRQVKNESELAAVLAHEIAHVNEKHMYLEIAPKRSVTLSESMVRMISRGGATLGGSLSKVVNKGVKILMETGLPKEKEYEADKAAVLYISSAGYDTSALHAFLVRIAENKNNLKISKSAPEFPERIAALEQFTKEIGTKSGMTADANVLKQRFITALSFANSQ